MTTALVMLRIEVDGHFHGMRSKAAIPRPWVAEIVGTCERNGLRRGDFVERMTDWSQAHVAHSGNLYGRVDMYALREGRVYEVSQCEGSPSRRHVKRRLYVAREGQLVEVQRHEAISMMAALEADNEEASCPVAKTILLNDRMCYQAGWRDEKIREELGMDIEEVRRLKQITGLAELFRDREFSEAWEPPADAPMARARRAR